MRKILFGILLVSLLVISGCSWISLSSGENTYDKIDNCEANIRNLNCEQLLECDIVCNEHSVTTRIIACHSIFTNYVIAKCVGGN